MITVISINVIFCKEVSSSRSEMYSIVFSNHTTIVNDIIIFIATTGKRFVQSEIFIIEKWTIMIQNTTFTEVYEKLNFC